MDELLLLLVRSSLSASLARVSYLCQALLCPSAGDLWRHCILGCTNDSATQSRQKPLCCHVHLGHRGGVALRSADLLLLANTNLTGQTHGSGAVIRSGPIARGVIHAGSWLPLRQALGWALNAVFLRLAKLMPID